MVKWSQKILPINLVQQFLFRDVVCKRSTLSLAFEVGVKWYSWRPTWAWINYFSYTTGSISKSIYIEISFLNQTHKKWLLDHGIILFLFVWPKNPVTQPAPTPPPQILKIPFEHFDKHWATASYQIKYLRILY